MFWPDEEFIRLVSRYIVKRTGLHTVENATESGVRLLSLGCGIGRHVIFADEMGLEAYGIDLSKEAVRTAVKWAEEKRIPEPAQKILQGDSRSLPWSDEFFGVVVSHGVLDHMSFEAARQSVMEVHRVLGPGGFLLCDLISGDDGMRPREYDGEEIVQIEHEKGTVQSYFNFSKVRALFDGFLGVIECLLVQRQNVLVRERDSRYYLAVQKRKSQP